MSSELPKPDFSNPGLQEKGQPRSPRPQPPPTPCKKHFILSRIPPIKCKHSITEELNNAQETKLKETRSPKMSATPKDMNSPTLPQVKMRLPGYTQIKNKQDLNQSGEPAAKKPKTSKHQPLEVTVERESKNSKRARIEHWITKTLYAQNFKEITYIGPPKVIDLLKTIDSKDSDVYLYTDIYFYYNNYVIGIEKLVDFVGTVEDIPNLFVAIRIPTRVLNIKLCKTSYDKNPKTWDVILQIGAGESVVQLHPNISIGKITLTALFECFMKLIHKHALSGGTPVLHNIFNAGDSRSSSGMVTIDSATDPHVNVVTIKRIAFGRTIEYTITKHEMGIIILSCMLYRCLWEKLYKNS